MIAVISASIGIMALILMINGNVVQAQEHYGHEKYSDEVEIIMHFEKSPGYYGKAVISTNGVDKKFDFSDKAQEYGSPLKVDYYYDYERPQEGEVCLKNVQSGNKNCVELYRDSDKIDIHMPD